MSREHIETPKTYYTIVGGSFRVQVSKDDPTAVMREWESADGKERGVKYERIVNALFGLIEEVSFADTKYGMQVYIKLDFNEKQQQPIIALNMASREAEDFLKRLPNIDLSKEVRLRPFNFEDRQSHEEVRGMEVMQPNEQGEFKTKITNFFRDAEKKENINGFPNPEGETADYSKDDWKIYFLSARKFLINYTKENICPKFRDLPQRTPRSLEEERGVEYPKADINPDDIPF